MKTYIAFIFHNLNMIFIKFHHVPHLLLSTYFFTFIYASYKKAILKMFKDSSKLGIDYLNIELHTQKLTKELAMKYIIGDAHFVYNFLSQCPSGRYQTIKYRGAWGRDSFLRHLVNTLNELLF